MSEERIIESTQTGIYCDNPNCGWHDDNVSDYENWINKPCPECGENLLTEKDFNDLKLLESMVGLINSFSEEQLKEMESLVDIEKLKRESILENCNGIELLGTNNDSKFLMEVQCHNGFKFLNLKEENG